MAVWQKAAAEGPAEAKFKKAAIGLAAEAKSKKSAAGSAVGPTIGRPLGQKEVKKCCMVMSISLIVLNLGSRGVSICTCALEEESLLIVQSLEDLRIQLVTNWHSTEEQTRKAK